MGENEEDVQLPRFIRLKDELGRESIHYNTVSKDCPEEVKLYAEKVLNETEENRRKGMERLRAFIKKEKLHELEDVYLIAILRCCKYDIRKSEVKLKKFLNVRRVVLQNLKEIDEEKINHYIADGFSQCLPWADKQARPIYIFRAPANLNLYDLHNMAAFLQACLFCVLKYPLPAIQGISCIVDININSLSVVIRMISELKKYIGLEKSVPLRIGRIDFVNGNVIFHYAFALIRPFLPSKIVDRIAFHGSDLTKLHKIYHPDILTDNFGGTLGPIDINLFRKEVIQTIRKLKSEYIA